MALAGRTVRAEPAGPELRGALGRRPPDRIPACGRQRADRPRQEAAEAV